ncbi:MAG: cupin domain-containing protein [Oscillospiraceae bacterium]
MPEILLKNLAHETVLPLKEQVQILPGQIVSKTLAQNTAVSITLFAFDKGEEIGAHDSEGDAMVTVLDGAGFFTVDGREYFAGAGETIIMPAKKPHAVYAKEPFKMLLIIVFPNSEKKG